MRLRYLAAFCTGSLCALVALGCRQAGSRFAGPFAYESAPPPAACGPLPLLADTSGWVTQPIFMGQLALRLPTGFARDTTVRYWHGGQRWRRGPVWVEQVGGHWDYSSFRPFRSSPAPRRHSECETRVGRFTVLFVEHEDRRRLRVTAWVRDTARVERVYEDREHIWRPNTVLAAEGPIRASALVRTIMRSLR